MTTFTQWAIVDGKYMQASETRPKLNPGAYDVSILQSGQLLFDPVPMRTEGLLKFPDSSIDAVVSEIETFWERDRQFKRYKIPHKRGILLWGPPGSGKSCTLQLVSRDIISRGGVVLLYDNPELFVGAYRVIRQIQPETPLVVLMEDLDAILKNTNESRVLNILDGVEAVDKICFLATTNYPERLTPRIYNRPSRFDRRVKIDHPNDPSREMYLKSLVLAEDRDQVDVARWVKDTDKFSLAHLKELFVSVHVLGMKYETSLKRLRSMQEETPMSIYDDTPEGQNPEFGGQYV